MAISGILILYPSVYLGASSVLAFGALSATPSLPPLVLLLAILRLQTETVIPRRQWNLAAGQLILTSTAIALANAAPSWNALSTPFVSVIAVAGLSFTTTSAAATALVLGYHIPRVLRGNWARFTAFPAIWATTWAIAEYVSPIGQLAAWSPLIELAGYEWVRPFGGQVAINWIVAMWATVLAEVLGAWIVDPYDEADEDVEGATHQNPAARPGGRKRSIWVAVLALLALTVPSYWTTDMPPPVSASDVTPFGVACALPYPQRNGVLTHTPQLADYIAESKTLQSEAKIILWPESAVHFNSPGDKKNAFAEIHKVIHNSVYYGVGFEEVVHEDSSDGVWKVGMKRNGLAIVGAEGVVYEYYKQHLVPIAESFGMTPAKDEQAAIFTIQLPHPKSWTGPAWAPGPNHTRPISLSASICLDFAYSSTLHSLSSRPALVLAPARTWHPTIGLTMWQHARARAAETGTTLLWCDGGAGGVSGLAGHGRRAFRQAGPGSWVQVASVQWPFDEGRTPFAVGGTRAALFVIFFVVGAGWATTHVGGTLEEGGRAVGAGVRRLADVWRVAVAVRRRHAVGEQQSLLG
ncbi:uncharacterized protein BXZ73DRAFT_39880 [Epithele typhae]|uniref:uncharacterized protein n=1 Tax=Epithele typhae TaxID=378194 RepID=UPI0020089A88|nr:uncharacterized protein BXZ73DRAFT_39880 [Epithele typhae]KAH9944176.1 hypothetical protein BXZ73DRAFT_39880 [Epithele typhae]